MCDSKNAGVAGYAEAFLPAHSDSQASEWYSYFENNVLVTNHEGMDKIVIDIAMEIAPIIADGGCLSFICDV